VLALLSLAPPPALADRERGLRLAREGRCPAALADLAAARAADPRDAEASLVTGQCLIRLKRYEEAAAALEVARAVSPGLEGVDISLAIARYHLEEYETARAAIARAEAKDADRADVQLYRGLLLLEAAENEAGIDAFESARALDPAYSEPVASFYQGLALGATGDRERARRVLRRVALEWPGTDWAEQAELALSRLDAPDFRGWLQASAGAEYDSNVVLRGSGVDLPDDISDDEDWRGVFTASGGVAFVRHPEWTLSVAGGYYGTEQDEVDAFDTHYPTASIWLDHPWSDTTVSRLRYEFGYAWVDEDPYLAAHRFGTSLFRSFGSAGQTELFAGYERDDYRFDSEDVPERGASPICPFSLCGPPGLNEASARNRDGQAFSGGLAHGLPLPDLGPLESPGARAGYAYTRYDSRGLEYSHRQHAFSLGASATLPLELVFDADATYAYRRYDDPTTFPEPGTTGEYARDDDDREEHQWTLRAALSRALTEQVSVALSWRYEDNDSNAEVFEYDRHVVGLKVTGSLGP
jgi:tetratricopeptide (TPR) repeat protein